MPSLMSADEIRRRAAEARRLSAPCRLCPRRCGADRTSGEAGYCGAGPEPAVACALPHFGEEPPVCGEAGAGTIFFSHCNLRCVYCQNHQISRGGVGSPVATGELAAMMLSLRDQGCCTIEPVSPTHHLPGLLEALASAFDEGLRLPVVYNTNGYEAPETLELLEGIVDVYLPDLKYSDPAVAFQYSDVEDYVEIAREAVSVMHAQVGNLVVDLKGAAVRGLILRHLVLPNDLSGTAATLAWVRDHLPRTVTLSLMAQYAPLHRSAEFPQLDRKLHGEEYDRAVDLAWEMGFENVFIQDLESGGVGIPDFCLDRPFVWR